MAIRDPRVDQYIAKSAEFARPILAHVRECVHAACPKVEETIKWGMPYFVYQGNLCGMAAFKQHCAFGFWKRQLIKPAGKGDGDAMGQFGRITALSDLPSAKVLAGYIKQAMALNEAGIQPPKTPSKKPTLAIPDDLVAALKRNRKAAAVFEKFAPSHRREYIEWLTEAKRAETRERRLATAIEWISEGKQRNWKYMNC
ncbi:MAG: YdeI/OmpD-associated family protein [Dokdonella sp.]